MIRGNIQGGGLEKDKKLGFAFLPFLFIFLILFLLPFFRPSTPRLRLTHSTNTINKNQIKKINSIDSLFIEFHLLPLLRFCLPSRTVILLTEITYFAHLYPNDPFPCHFRTQSHQSCLILPIILYFFAFFALLPFLHSSLLLSCLFSFRIRIAKTQSTNVYPEVTICASRVAYRRT